MNGHNISVSVSWFCAPQNDSCRTVSTASGVAATLFCFAGHTACNSVFRLKINY